MMKNPRVLLKLSNDTIRLQDGIMDTERLIDIKNLNFDFLFLPETNLNWCFEQTRKHRQKIVKRSWPKSIMFYISIKSNKDNFHFQGGLCTIVTCKWAPYIITSNSEKLGRWKHITMCEQRNKKVSIITTYRPVPGKSKYSSTGTVWRKNMTTSYRISNTLT